MKLLKGMIVLIDNEPKITEEKENTDIARGNNKMVISLEQREAYSELLEILRHMEKKYVDKIPKKLIMFFYDNCSLDYEFRMTEAIGKQQFKPKTLDLLALLNFSYWSKNKSKEELIMDYAVIDEKTQKQLNSQLEKDNIFTKIEVSHINVDSNSDSNSSNLPVVRDAFTAFIKKAFMTITGISKKIYRFIKSKITKQDLNTNQNPDILDDIDDFDNHNNQ